MAKRPGDDLALQLETMLAPAFSGITVEIGREARWNRPCVTFHWHGFADLLPEERFHRLVGVIPEDFRASRMGGVIWLELAPNETVDAFLKLPRSEDVVGREPAILRVLDRVDFFGVFADRMGPSPDKRCDGDFAVTLDVLAKKKVPCAGVHDAKLLFIRYGAYCDCQVLLTARPALSELRVQAT